MVGVGGVLSDVSIPDINSSKMVLKHDTKIFVRLTSSTYQLLSSETNYTVFSNSVLQDRGANYNNLESIHDGVHALVGDGGHMTYFSMAAFDPIFWMHHW